MIRPGWLLFVKSFLASCFCRAGTNHIVKYELPAERVEVEITLSGYSSRSNYYRWGGYSGVRAGTVGIMGQYFKQQETLRNPD